jgi:hypothetical protein
MQYQHQDFPAWRYGPDGKSAVFESEDGVPKGWHDHPSKVKGAAPAEGTQTAIAPSNGTTSAAEAAKTTTAKSQTSTPPEVAAKTDPVGAAASAAKPSDETNKNADPSTITLDADGHAYDPKLHAGTGSKTKAGLWRMKVGVKRPAPKTKPPLDL